VAFVGAIAVIFAARLFIGFAAVTIRQVQPAQSMLTDRQWSVMGSAIAFLLGLLYVYGVVRLFRVRTFGRLSSVEGVLRKRWLMLCLAVAFGSVIIGDVVAFLLGQFDGSTKRPFYYWLEGLTIAPPFPTILAAVLILLAGALWPYLAQGIAFQAAGFFSSKLAAGLMTVTIVAIIVDSLDQPTYSILNLLVSITSALVGTWLAWRSGGLEAVMALNAILLLSGAMRQLGAGALGLTILPSDGLYVLGGFCGPLLFALIITALIKIMGIKVTSSDRP
jgi:hypothetical protein